MGWEGARRKPGIQPRASESCAFVELGQDRPTQRAEESASEISTLSADKQPCRSARWSFESWKEFLVARALLGGGNCARKGTEAFNL